VVDLATADAGGGELAPDTAAVLRPG
jgi:hypothetical protein